MMNMNRSTLIFALASTMALHAQTTTPSTTASAAIPAATANQSGVIALTSITGIVGQTLLYVDTETMQVVGDPTNAAAVKVIRGYSSYGAPNSHASGAKVWIGKVPSQTVVPGASGFSTRTNVPNGTCTRTSQTYLPIVYYNIGRLRDCDANTSVWVDYLSSGAPVFVTDAGANNAITSAVGSQPAYTGIRVSVTLAHSLQAGANTFAYAGGTALGIKSSRNPANNIGTAYVATGVVTLQLALISSTLTWLDVSQ